MPRVSATDTAVEATMSTMRRGADEPPTQIHHLNDEVVRRLLREAQDAVTEMKEAAAAVEESPFTHFGLITVSNVLCTSSVNGGGANETLLETSRRSANQSLTKKQRLTGLDMNTLIRNATEAVAKVAKATQPPPGVDLGPAFSSTFLFIRTSGRPDQTLMETPKLTIINPGGERALGPARDTLRKALALPEVKATLHDDTTNNMSSDSPIVIDGGMTLIINRM